MVLTMWRARSLPTWYQTIRVYDRPSTIPRPSIDYAGKTGRHGITTLVMSPPGSHPSRALVTPELVDSYQEARRLAVVQEEQGRQWLVFPKAQGHWVRVEVAARLQEIAMEVEARATHPAFRAARQLVVRQLGGRGSPLVE